MNGITIVFFFIVSFIAVSRGHYNSLVRNNGYSLHNIHRDLGLSCSCEDLVTLVGLVRALEEKDCCSAGHAPSGGLSNAEDLIMNLVNALIQLTTQALSHNCHCPNQSGNNYPHNPGNGGPGSYPNHNGGSGYSHSNGGLLSLDLLDPTNKDNNVLDLDLARQHLLGVALGGGGGSSQGSNGHYKSNGRNTNGGKDAGSGYSHSDGGLLSLDLLDPTNKDNNVLDLDLARQHLLGVALGGGGGSSQGSNGHYKSNGRNANGGNDDGLINVNLLNLKNNNDADVNLGNQHLVGVGGGSSTPQTTDTKSKTGSNGKGSNSGEGLNVEVLNLN